MKRWDKVCEQNPEMNIFFSKNYTLAVLAYFLFFINALPPSNIPLLGVVGRRKLKHLVEIGLPAINSTRERPFDLGEQDLTLKQTVPPFYQNIGLNFNECSHTRAFPRGVLVAPNPPPPHEKEKNKETEKIEEKRYR